MDLYFIVNPKARSGSGAAVWQMIEPELIRRKVPYQCFRTVKRKQAGEFAGNITGDGKEHTLVVLGGDGTINEVLNGIRHPEKTLLGYIPAGSGNDFARGLDLERDPLKALDRILDPEKVISMDIGAVLPERGGKARRFLISGGMGYDAAVCHEVCVSKWKKILNRIGAGKLCYAVAALDRLVKERPFRMTLYFQDGRKEVFDHTLFCAFMNLPFEGGGFRFCPDARPDDGMLDVIIAHDITVPKAVLLLLLAPAGKHAGFGGVSVVRCRSARVETEKAVPLHTDGEPGFLRKKFEVRILKEKLRIIT